MTFAVWISHIVGWGVLGLVVLGHEIYRLRRFKGPKIRQMLLGASHLALFGLPAFLTYFWLQDFSSSSHLNMPQFAEKVKYTLSIFKVRWVLVDLFFLGAIAMFAVYAVFSRTFKLAQATLFSVLLLGLAFLFLPQGVSTTFFLDRRILMPLGIIFFISATATPDSTWEKRWNIIAPGLATLFSATMILGWFSIEKRIEDERRNVDFIDVGERVLSLKIDRCLPGLDRWELPKPFAGTLDIVVQKKGFSNAAWDLPASNGLDVKYARDVGLNHSEAIPVALETCIQQRLAVRGAQTIEQAVRSIPPDVFEWLWISNTDGEDLELGPRFVFVRGTQNTSLFQITE